MTLNSPLRVAVLAYDRLCGFEFGVATELFGLERPELGIDWYEFGVIVVDPPPIRMAGGVTIDAPGDLDEIRRAGTVVIPGWRDLDRPPPEAVVDALIEAHRRGARIMSICSGVFLVAATGLLDGRSATTHWRYTDRLAAMYPAIDVRPDVLYVDNGSVLTSAGSAAGIDLGLHLIRRDHGADVANRVARRLVVPPHRDGGQAQFISTPVRPAELTTLAPVLDWALANLAQPLTVGRLAREAHMAPRTFARRFRDETGVTPHHWVVRQRVALARRLLETTEASIDRIAEDSGFRTAATLRHHFRSETRTTPTAYRAAFRAGTVR